MSQRAHVRNAGPCLLGSPVIILLLLLLLSSLLVVINLLYRPLAPRLLG